MVLVVGSTGMLGSEICRQLIQKSIPVRALIRSTSDAAKVAQLKSLGCEIVEGDLKTPGTLARACQGVEAVISTASSTFSRQEGDSIQTVDLEGQLHLVDAAQKAGVRQFILISFPDTAGYPNPLNDAKRAAERRLQESGMNYVSLQANYFMEIWLSPALGFDYPNHTVRMLGDGTAKQNPISFTDVAKIAVACLGHPAAQNKIIPIGGPDNLSMQEIIQLFEDISGDKFAVDTVPQAALEQQKANAGSPLEASFAGLMLAFARGLSMDTRQTAAQFGVTLSSVADYAKRVLGK